MAGHVILCDLLVLGYPSMIPLCPIVLGLVSSWEGGVSEVEGVFESQMEVLYGLSCVIEAASDVLIRSIWYWNDRWIVRGLIAMAGSGNYKTRRIAISMATTLIMKVPAQEVADAVTVGVLDELMGFYFDSGQVKGGIAELMNKIIPSFSELGRGRDLFNMLTDINFIERLTATGDENCMMSGILDAISLLEN